MIKGVQTAGQMMIRQRHLVVHIPQLNAPVIKITNQRKNALIIEFDIAKTDKTKSMMNKNGGEHPADK